MLNPKAFASAAAAVGGLAMLFLGLSATYLGIGGDLVALKASVYLGFGPTLLGSLTGAVWGAASGFVAGFLFAWVYNLVSQKTK